MPTDQEILTQVKHIILKELPNAQVFIFGSRAKGSFNKRSDFDIAIKGKNKIPLSIITKIKDELEAIRTLKSFDIIDLNNVDKEFKSVIQKDLQEI